LQEKRKASGKIEKLNHAKEQIKAIQREIDEMKEQENNSPWQESQLQNSGPYRETPKQKFFTGNGISQFVDSESPLSIGVFLLSSLWGTIFSLSPTFLMRVLKSVSKQFVLVFWILKAILCARSSPRVKFLEPIFPSVLALLVVWLLVFRRSFEMA
jgi:hypothetical protein